MNTIDEDIELAKYWAIGEPQLADGTGQRDVCHRLASEVERLQKPDCKWTEDEEGNYATGCGSFHAFIHGGPTANKHRFCPYCGGKLEVTE